MKKGKSELTDWGRRSYKRSDVGNIKRGKYAKRVSEATNVVVLDPEVAKAFPNDDAANAALLRLIASEQKPNAKIKSKRKSKPSQKKRAA
jgi:hypothetical protein